MKTFFLVFLIFAAFLFLPFGRTAEAADVSIRFDGPKSAPVGSEIPVTVFIDSDQPLNAYSIELSFDPEKIGISGVNTGRSVIDLWQRQPLVSAGAVSILGASIRAFQGKGGELAEMSVKTLAPGKTTIGVKSADVFLANGKGTKIEARTRPFSLSIEKQGTPLELPVVADGDPPVLKNVSVTPDPFHPERIFVGFSFEDRGSGVSEVFTRYRTWFSWTEWTPAINPAAFPDSAWAIGLRGVDNRGNTSETVVYRSAAVIRRLGVFGIALLAVLSAAILGTARKRRKKV